jgi:hypothetical protein
MKANNKSTGSSRPDPPNDPPEENDAFLSYATILSESYRQRTDEDSSPPPLPLMQSRTGVTRREHLLAILNDALAIISDSDSSDFVSDANSPSFTKECSRRQ